MRWWIIGSHRNKRSPQLSAIFNESLSRCIRNPVIRWKVRGTNNESGGCEADGLVSMRLFFPGTWSYSPRNGVRHSTRQDYRRRLTYSTTLRISSSFETWNIIRVHLLLGLLLGPWLATRGQYITKAVFPNYPILNLLKLHNESAWAAEQTLIIRIKRVQYVLAKYDLT